MCAPRPGKARAPGSGAALAERGGPGVSPQWGGCPPFPGLGKGLGDPPLPGDGGTEGRGGTLGVPPWRWGPLDVGLGVSPWWGGRGPPRPCCSESQGKEPGLGALPASPPAPLLTFGWGDMVLCPPPSVHSGPSCVRGRGGHGEGRGSWGGRAPPAGPSRHHETHTGHRHEPGVSPRPPRDPPAVRAPGGVGGTRRPWRGLDPSPLGKGWERGGQGRGGGKKRGPPQPGTAAV